MTSVVLPVVVDSVEESIASDFRGATGGAVYVIALEGDLVLRASEVEGPVVVAVASSTPVGGAVNFAVRDGHATGGEFAEDDVLTADSGGPRACC